MDWFLELRNKLEVDFHSTNSYEVLTLDWLWIGAGVLVEDNRRGLGFHGVCILDEIWASAFLDFGEFHRYRKMLLILF